MPSLNPMNLIDVESPEHFQELLSKDLNRVSLINFWAPWAEPCKQMNQVVLELAKKYEDVLVLQVSPLLHLSTLFLLISSKNEFLVSNVNLANPLMTIANMGRTKCQL